MPKGTLLKTKIFDPSGKKVKLILVYDLGLYPKQYYQAHLKEDNPNFIWDIPRRLKVIASDIDPFMPVIRAIKNEIAVLRNSEFWFNQGVVKTLVDPLYNAGSAVTEVNTAYVEQIEYICKNNDVVDVKANEAKYHTGPDTFKVTGDIVIIGTCQALVANSTRYYNVPNMPISIGIDCCEHCYENVLPEIKLFIDNRTLPVIDKTDMHDPDQNRNTISGIFQSLTRK